MSTTPNATSTGRQRPTRSQTFWQRIFHDRQGRIVLWQRPSPILIAWAIITFLSLFVPNGLTESIFYWASESLLGIWAVLEIWKGADHFRRAVGLLVLVLVVLAALNIF